MLYKVTSPRDTMIFTPSPFWHTANWESSSNHPIHGYVRDEVLYVGDFDEVNIHLMPKVRRMRFWRSLKAEQLLSLFSFGFPHGTKVVMVADMASRKQVNGFHPTIYTFANAGFENVRNGEYVARCPQTAVSVETISFNEAMERWHFQVLYTTQYDDIAKKAKESAIYFDEQT